MAQTTIEQDIPDGQRARTRDRAVLDKARYISADVMPGEWEKIWSKCWLFAGLVSDVTDPGDYFVYEVGHESVVVMRGEEGELSAFYNVCQHRGNRILTNKMGWVQQIACPYHGWQYSLTGALAHVPDAERFSPSIDAAQRSLKPVKIEVWAGLVWLNLDPQAVPLAQFLGPIVENLTPYHFENMQLAQHQTVSLDANWKTVRDNFLEQYHVDFIHPQHAGFVDCCNSTNTLLPLGHSSTVVEGYVTNSRYPVPDEVPEPLEPMIRGLGFEPSEFSGGVPTIRKAVQQRKRELGAELGFDYSELNDEQLSDVWQYDVFPNTFMTIQPEELWIFGPRPHPTDPGKCFLDKFTLQVPTEVACDASRGIMLNPRITVSQKDDRPEHEEFTRAEILDGSRSLTITIDQDVQYLPDMQAGMHSAGFAHAVLNEDEIRLQHFHDWVDEWLNSP